ncbi:MAG TPA: pyruvate dehydrogenase (acetyl-transferring) E1 component subunit alpha [Gemmatimonadales bacterium]|nr:pyruvate dehydrogenase (acetyl-transferring) E1 component subunit alpha [Gemmatimonadales bacterium]
MTATAGTPPALDAGRREFYVGLLRQMILVRRFEERAAEAYAQGKIGGFCHLYIGQEAVATGATATLRQDDYIVTSYREHAHALVRGTSARAVMAELFGKATGCSGGKGGSMHLFDVARGFLGGHAIVGSHIPIAAGAAFAIKSRGTDQVAVCFFGEAAVNIGAFHETLNMAALWGLPAVFICENNRYGMGTALERAAAVYDISHRACSYDMASEIADGMDVLAMVDATARAVARAREEKLPTLIEARTYRYMGHSMADPIHGHYRTKEELEEQKRHDPIEQLSRRLREAELLDDGDVEALKRSVEEEVDDAVRFSDESPDPDPAALHADVYRD